MSETLSVAVGVPGIEPGKRGPELAGTVHAAYDPAATDAAVAQVAVTLSDDFAE